ncbi:MAG: PDZ domain-containing protein [Pseudomonadota bacterium]|nr:PDZ domain-containing protein [Pseudomonadota bacterium]
MPLKAAMYVGLVAAGALAGALSAWLFRSHSQASASDAEAFPGVSIAGHDEDVQLLRAQYVRQLEQLGIENEALQSRLSEAVASGAVQPSTPDEHRARFTELLDLDKMKAANNRRAVAMLLAAGYSPDQIEGLRARLERLRNERAVAVSERRARNLPSDPVKELAHQYDPDIELRYEIGDDEYERYLRALERPTNVDVTEVLPGSVAGSAGIRAGDVILAYDNKRLFNLGELDGMAMGKSGKSVPVTIDRGGEILKLVVPGGPFGIRSRNATIVASVRL